MVLPILHLNGYKIANPAVLARIPEEELVKLMQGYGYRPHIVAGDDPVVVHALMAETLDSIFDEIAAYKDGRADRLPMLILRTPKGWTGPREVDGLPVERTWRAHQVPLIGVRDNPAQLAMLEEWMRSYRPEDLFDDAGSPVAEIRETVSRGDHRMSASPYANGGELLRPLVLPDFRDNAVEVKAPAVQWTEPTRVLGTYLRDVAANPDNFSLMGPDETASNRLNAVFEATGRAWNASVLPTDQHLAAGGRVMEVLSEHLCQGWLEGYLLTGRHGLFNCYEAFIHIVDAMFNQHAKWLEAFNQHAKWLEAFRDIPWRSPIASLNYLLSSHVWRQDKTASAIRTRASWRWS
ncbi:phosphoketolase [Planotetraspora sp. GP83]